MCGFAGFVITARVADPLATARLMGERIAHRGPDDAQYYADSRVALAFRRLSIIDLEGGRQPLANEDGSCVLVFNGEVYNYRQLRTELARRGHRFATESDSEVVLHGYEEYGRGILDRLRGMFAFVIWDKRTNTLFGARDIFGIKPLYVYDGGGEFLFASEVKAFLDHPGFATSVRCERLADYLSYSYLPDDETLFEGVRKVLPAHWFTWRDGHFDTGCYYELAYRPDRSLSEGEWAERIQAVLDDSVAAHLVADVEVGAFLSSGVDSSYLVQRAAAAGSRLRTFSVGYEEARYSELAQAQWLAGQLGVDNRAALVSAEQFFDATADIQYFMDEPLPNPSENPLYFLAQDAARSVKVVISGEGADELFGGYPNYQQECCTAAYERRVAVPLRAMLGAAASALPAFRGRNFLVRGARQPWQRNSRADYVFGAQERLRFLSDDVRRAADASPGPQEASRRYFDEVPGADAVTQLQYADMNTWLPYDILLKADRMSMAHSLELRVPYLDREVLELALTLPVGQRVSSDRSKIALRAAAGQVLPRQVASREKLGFPSPLASWLREDAYYERVREAFGSFAAREFFAPAELMRLLDEHRAGARTGVSHMQRIWSFYSFILWHDQFFGASKRARRRG